jgi:hypothetical protein
MKRVSVCTAVTAAALAVLLAAPALAQQAPRQKPLPKNASELVLTNARPATLTGFEVSRDGKKFATLRKPLEAGKRVTIKLPKNADCEFVVNAAFADEALHL